jgi:hypothetical protein
VDGYPRAFVFEVKPDDLGELRRTDNWRYAQIVLPAREYDPIKGEAGQPRNVPFAVRLDVQQGDEIALSLAGEELSIVGERIDQDRAEHAWGAPAKEGALVMETRVGDFVGPDAREFMLSTQNRRVVLQAAVRTADENDAIDECELILDTLDPEVKRRPPSPPRVFAGDENAKVTISAVATDAAGVKSVEAFMVSDPAKLNLESLGPDDLKGVPPLPLTLSDTKTNTWTRTIAADGLPARTTHAVFVRATDEAGRATAVKKAGEFRVDEKPVTPMVKGVLVKGRAIRAGDRSGYPGVEVTLTPKNKDPKLKPRSGVTKEVVLDAGDPFAGRPRMVDYYFEIKDVLPGEYVMTAKGKTKAGQALAELEKGGVPLSIEEGREDPVEQDIKIGLAGR